MREDIGEHRLLRRLEDRLGHVAVFVVNRLTGTNGLVQCEIDPVIGPAALDVGLIGVPDDWIVSVGPGARIESLTDAEAERIVWGAALGAALWERRSWWSPRTHRSWGLGGPDAPGPSGWTRVETRQPWADDIESRTPSAIRAATAPPLRIRIW